mgnify:CR=1 FL=1|jgi:hypothetical protein
MMANKERSDKQLIGAAGEYLVLSRLLARELLASQAPRGTRKADILVNPLDGGRPILIQVKTRSQRGKRQSWTMQAKHEVISEKDLFYCFVDLEVLGAQVYVVPSAIVAKAVKSTHEKWLKTPGKKGQDHNDSSMRIISNNPRVTTSLVKDGWLDQYLENWEQIY